jgi:hypothetical protein
MLLIIFILNWQGIIISIKYLYCLPFNVKNISLLLLPRYFVVEGIQILPELLG